MRCQYSRDPERAEGNYIPLEVLAAFCRPALRAPAATQANSLDLYIVYSNESFASDLEKMLIGGFNVSKIANAAHKLYADPALELDAHMDRVLLTLMPMDFGPEFELTESEFVALIEAIRAR